MTMGSGYVVGVDTGGTFTDIVIIDSAGGIHFDKAFSTPNDPSEGVLNALESASKFVAGDVREVAGSILRFSHGTTVGTNAVIQRRGARVGLVMTKGFEDTALIGRGPMGKNGGIPHVQATDFVHNERPAPLVGGALTRGVGERIAVDGRVIAPLNEAEARRAVRELLDEGVESIAICCLWSLRNDAHERRIAELAREASPDLSVSLSAEISPVLGEFPRTMTTIVNAYVGPVLVRYVDRLHKQLTERGLRVPLQLMMCSGGATLSSNVQRKAVSLVNSGVVGGLVAARYLGSALGYENVITTDMGGTSFDVGIIHRGRQETEKMPFVAQGIPVQVPSAQVVTIGAGGGSIAWTDGDRLMVGPQSAGADPGPACYGMGGTEPTVTDALLVLGLLDPDNFFGGRKRLDRSAAEAAILDRVGRPLGMTAREAAAGIYEIITAKMGDLIRKTTVESGYDPREFVVFAYGGAAPAHACLYSAALGAKEVVVPYSSSVFSALGCALSDITYSYARSEPTTLEANEPVFATFRDVFGGLEEQALADMAESGYSPEEVVLLRKLDLRYEGQMSEITIDWRPGELTAEGAQEIRRIFEESYETRFGAGTSRKESPMEIITFRVDALKEIEKPVLRREEEGDPDPSALLRTTRDIYLRDVGTVRTNIYDGDLLRPGHEIPGPAVVERRDTSVFVPVGQVARVDPYRNLRIGVAR
ncbi:MAG: hydantoinase/oxoprolinase family protein [Streptosporangiales bacterium]|nr:hydantoinase/oxoprolinase family protein [Streptosporangiales bacterium]